MTEKEMMEKLLSLEATYALLLEREEKRNKDLESINERLNALDGKLASIVTDISELKKLNSLKKDMTNFKKDTSKSIDNLNAAIQKSFDSMLENYKKVTKDLTDEVRAATSSKTNKNKSANPRKKPLKNNV